MGDSERFAARAAGVLVALAVCVLCVGSPQVSAANAATGSGQPGSSPGSVLAQADGAPSHQGDAASPTPAGDAEDPQRFGGTEEETAPDGEPARDPQTPAEDLREEEGPEDDPAAPDADADTDEEEADADDEDGAVVRPATAPSVTTSEIPLGSILVAVAVLLGSLLVVVRLGRAVVAGRSTSAAPTPAVDRRTDGPMPAADADDRDRFVAAPEPPTSVHASDRETLQLLLVLGEALLDAGDAVNHVEEALTEVARVNGIAGLGVMVLPTALVVSVPGAAAIQTEVARAGSARLRLDQTEALFRLVRRARRAEVSPAQATEEVRRIRAAPPLYGRSLRLAGYLAFTIGLVLLLRGGWLETLVAGGLALVIGGVQLLSARLDRTYQPFLPVLGAALVAVVVFSLGRVLPELSVFPPLVAPLVAFLPGALLTMAVYELATGQILSGSSRLAAGMLQLVLLALGIVAGAQLVGVPAAELATAGTSPVSIALPWLGVAVFGVGVLLFNGGQRTALPWMLLVLYVAYAGQVVGGLFFGPTMSAFFGAVAMTPVAMLVARQPSGPPTLVSFLPGFWLLVPGAMGLAGVTSLLDEDRIEGLGSLVDMGTSMVGITLGILLGLAIGSHLTALVTRWGTPSGPLAAGDATAVSRPSDRSG